MSTDDAAAREAIRTRFLATLVVEAAAGTGKTTELVERILGLLLSGRTTLPRIVALSFTDKASGEMKLRLRARIESARNEPGANIERLDKAIEELELAHITTIHSFCANMLRERPIAARVDPLFEVMPSEGQARLFESTFQPWFEQTLADPPEGVRRLLRRRPSRWQSLTAREQLARAAMTLVEQRDFAAPWRRDLSWDRERAIDAVVQELARLVELQRRGTAITVFSKSIDGLAQRITEMLAPEAHRPRDYDGLEERLRNLQTPRFTWTQRAAGRMFGADVTCADAVALRDGVWIKLEKFCNDADADLAAHLHNDLRPLIERYEQRKNLEGRLDFLDLLLLTRNLLRDDRAVRNQLQQQFTHVLVDEFQDTDPLQAEILLLLCADDPAERDHRRVHPIPGKLFVVGDPKQSIYRFRRADVVFYERVKRQLAHSGAELVHLSKSFRAVQSIQSAINAAFAPEMGGRADDAQAAYVPLERVRKDPTTQPTVVVLPVPEPYGDSGYIGKDAIEKSFPDAAGAFIDWLIRSSGWTTEEPNATGGLRVVPIQARHVCLLFRRFASAGQDITQKYTRALENRGIGHVLVGGRSLHERDEVVAMRNALEAIEWPDDDVSVFATLHGPLFALSDEALLTYRLTFNNLHPLARVEPERLDEVTTPVADALGVLKTLHYARNRRPIAATLADLLAATRAHAGLALWPAGEQVLGNVARLLDQARTFERAGATSFRAFVKRLGRESERGGAGEATVVEEGTDGVRLMTVHGAKGLEFPVVILADPTAPLAHTQPSRYIDPDRGLWVTPLAGCVPLELLEQAQTVLDHERQEAIRVAYVAATRARDVLVVPAVGDGARPGWLEALNKVVFPAPGRWRDARPAPGCPEFGYDSVYKTPDRAMRDPGGSVQPGLHTSGAQGVGVVWWDPARLALGAVSKTGMHHEILKKEGDSPLRDASEAAYCTWRDKRAAVTEAARRPVESVLQVSEWAKGSAGTSGATPSSVEFAHTLTVRANRPSGPRFGTLVHAVLASVAFRADDGELAALVRVLAKSIGARDDEQAAARDAVRSALAHPVMVQAAVADAAGQCRREAPLMFVDAEGNRVEGTLDLAFVDGAAWVVVDFKTDVELAGKEAVYTAQVEGYVRAVAQATGRMARGVVLSV